eukprot:c4517_g1_i1.p1 GENE.c4517_g1_i1~~c4517_g1_i1.p1  ORF type:complete len:475 (+),score=184.24 c4517_g1_i1:57-1427(+)
MASITVTTQNEFESVAHDTTLQSFLSVVSIVAPAAPAPTTATEQKRTGIDLVAVLDRSGSMAGEKMKMLHRTVELLIQHLKDIDRLALVSYDDNVETPLELTKMDENGKSKARDALKNITDRGCTNLSGGLMQGLEVLANRQTKNEVSSVLLMTDGLANRGVTDKTQLVEMTRAKVQSLNNPTTVYTFGFGSDHDAALLGQMADAGRGSYYFMNTPDSIPQAFADCVGGLMSVVAQNIELTITSASQDVVIRDVVTNFPKTVVVANQKFTVRIGDLFSEERKDILVELQLPAVSTAMEAHALLGVEVALFDIATVSTVHVQAVATVKRTASDSGLGASSLAVDQQRNRIRTARAMEQAMQLGDRGDVAQARALLEQVRLDVGASASSAAPECLNLLSDLTSVAQNMRSQHEYQAVAQKKLNVKARKHWAQRAGECDDAEADSYATGAKMSMKAAFK